MKHIINDPASVESVCSCLALGQEEGMLMRAGELHLTWHGNQPNDEALK